MKVLKVSTLPFIGCICISFGYDLKLISYLLMIDLLYMFRKNKVLFLTERRVRDALKYANIEKKREEKVKM